SAATKLGLNPRWLKTIVYGAGILGASYAYQFYNQVGESSGSSRIDDVTGDIESATRIAQNTGTFVEEVQITRLLEACEQAINDSYTFPNDTLVLDNRDYVCQGYVQRAQEVIAQMTEKIETCSKELADMELARKRVTEQLNKST